MGVLRSSNILKAVVGLWQQVGTCRDVALDVARMQNPNKQASWAKEFRLKFKSHYDLLHSTNFAVCTLKIGWAV